MRILFIGQAPFGAEALEALLTQGEQLVGVITTPDHPRQRAANPVTETAQKHGLPLLQTALLKRPETISWVQKQAPDLLVLAFVTSFVPAPMINLAKLGGINYHPSLLPKYRGGSAINWTIINGERETGVTIHYIDEGVDTGPILLQEKVRIKPDDTVKSLYFGKLYPLGITMICESVRLIRAGEARPVPQDESLASFQPVITANDAVIDWQQPTDTVYNLIRGTNPSPGAASCLHGKICRIFDCAKGSGQGRPGSVLTIDTASFSIATADGAIAVQKIQPPENKKLAAADFVDAIGLSVGDRFTTLTPDSARQSC
jgi:methionyl-tRNA formyltransferase